MREERKREKRKERGRERGVRWPHIRSLNARSAHYTWTPPPPVKLTESERKRVAFEIFGYSSQAISHFCKRPGTPSTELVTMSQVMGDPTRGEWRYRNTLLHNFMVLSHDHRGKRMCVVEKRRGN